MNRIAQQYLTDISDHIVQQLERDDDHSRGDYGDQDDHRRDVRIFTDRLFEGLLPGDADSLDLKELTCVASSAFEQFRVRYLGEHAVKILELEATGRDDCAYVQILADDRPFLVGSVTAELQARNIDASVLLHPIFRVERDGDGRLIQIVEDEEEAAGAGVTQESFILIRIASLPDADEYDVLTAALWKVLETVNIVVADWRPMIAQVDEIICALRHLPEEADIEDIDEALAFLEWLKEDRFTFIGMNQLRLTGDIDDEAASLEPIDGSGLGILRGDDAYVLRKGLRRVHFSPEIWKFFSLPSPLIVTKANVVSPIRRRTHLDYVGVKIYGENGRVSGELRIVGLFTSVAYTHSTRTLPVVRQKVNYALENSGFPPSSHGAKALLNVLETYPRSELFQIDKQQLLDFAVEIQSLADLPKVRVFSRVDEFDRFVSVLLYVPRSKFTTEVRTKIGELLSAAYAGRVSAFYPDFSSGQLVRIHYIIGRYSGVTPRPDPRDLECHVSALLRSWQDQLEDGLKATFTSGIAHRLYKKYENAFSTGFQNLISIDHAIDAIQHIESLSEDNPLGIKFYQGGDRAPDCVRVQLFHLGGPIKLSQRVPTFENLGFDVIEEWSDRVWVDVAGDAKNSGANIHDMVLAPQDGAPVDLEAVDKKLSDCLHAIWRGEAVNDTYNRLILAIGATWREVALIRGLGAYLQQICLPFSQDYLSETLLRHFAITRQLIDLFHLRFDPEASSQRHERMALQVSALEEIDEAFQDVPSLDEDRILRHFANLISATVRTNFYQLNESGGPQAAIAFKLNSPDIEGLPQPVPFAEIFVYAPRVQGIHLRGGPVARGGLRWSDRRQDFRTEVLGLAKAQQVKNTVIVPKGSKGGFVPQDLPVDGDRAAVYEEGIACYRLFISSLLSVTDNICSGEIVPPERTIRHDGDDPYLVVAADKGTAAFSDYANEISQSHNFWLGDAFASGGSAGYDHKKMGITARGAWEAVKRHFREMDKDIQSEPFTVIGVGDMSGDVFGNGMLLSRSLKLVAAFDHRDVFIDPDPDPAIGWPERKRLFDLGRSSWQDYDQSLISRGGGVFSRVSKFIELSEEVRSLTGLQSPSVTPNELIQSLLCLSADLLWFGGIGTYVRADHETDELVGDRANDALRIVARDLNVKVVGEGANLGMTQAARIAFSLGGGRVNTDAVDNSAGVNSSDLEVNIKIALGAVVEAGQETLESRNTLLADMTDDVATRCLQNNYLQSLAISLEERRSVADLYAHQRFMRGLEAAGALDRELETLPSDAELEERVKRGIGLTRPELAVLFGYAKLQLADALSGSELLEDPYFEKVLLSYFPELLLTRHEAFVRSHRLRQDIIATGLTNSTINRCGVVMVLQLTEETGLHEEEIVRAFVAALDVFDLEGLFAQIDAADNKISGAFQLALYQKVQSFLQKQTGWFLRNGDWHGDIGETIALFRKGIEDFVDCADRFLPPGLQAKRDRLKADYLAGGVSESLAARICNLDILTHGPDMVHVCSTSGQALEQVMAAFFVLRGRLQLDLLSEKVSQMAMADHYDRLASTTTLETIGATVRALVGSYIQDPNGFDARVRANNDHVGRTQKAVEEILSSGDLSVAKLAIVASALRELADS